jgi:fructose-1,6-bisphosphatase/inositol monophosphatase family enzyme
VLIALGQEGKAPDLGMIDQPYIRERFWGDGAGAFCSAHDTSWSIKTRSARALEDATLFTTFPEVGRATDRLGFEAVAANVKLVRYGMDCYAYALLAAGQIDLVIEAGLAAYDIQGPMAVIHAAGGIVSNWRGRSAHEGGQVVAAANAEIHAAALQYLQEYAD